MRINKSVEMGRAERQKKRPPRLARLALIGTALVLSMLSLAWACTVHGVQSRFVPATGPVGTTVAVVATTLSSYNGTNNIYIDGPITTPGTVGDLTAMTQTVCNAGVSSPSPDIMGSITYVSGVGRGTGTIPTTVRSHTVAAGETYEMCVAPGFEHFRVI